MAPEFSDKLIIKTRHLQTKRPIRTLAGIKRKQTYSSIHPTSR